MKKIVLAAFLAVCAAQITVQGWLIYRWENVLRHGQAFKFRTAPVDPYDAFRGRYIFLNFEAARMPMPVEADYPDGKMVTVAVDEGPDGFARLTLVQDPPASGAWLKVRATYADRNPWFETENIANPAKLADRILHSDGPIATFIRKSLNGETRAKLEAPGEITGILLGLIQPLSYQNFQGDSTEHIPYGRRVAMMLEEFEGCLMPPPPARLPVQLPFDRFYMTEGKAPQAEQAYWNNNRRSRQRAYARVRILDGLALIENVFIGDTPIGEFVEQNPEK